MQNIRGKCLFKIVLNCREIDMTGIAELKKGWEAHESRKFPLGVRGKKFNGIDLTQLESQLGSYIITMLNLDGSLNSRLQTLFIEQKDLLEGVLPSLHGDIKSYFEELNDVADLAIKLF